MSTLSTSALFAGTTLEIETAFGSAVIDLEDAASDAPPGPVTELLQPRYTIRRSGAVLYVKQPLGAPEDRRRLVLGAALLGFVVMVLLAAK